MVLRECAEELGRKMEHEVILRLFRGLRKDVTAIG